MNKSELFQKKHELWLSLLFGAFSVKDERIFDILYDFAMIEYRHLVWLGGALAEEKIAFDYEKGEIDFKAEDNFALFHKLIHNIEDCKKFYEDDESQMFQRFTQDENYFVQKIILLLEYEKNDAPIIAFDKSRKLENFDLNREQIDALTLFLFEEGYKEYELVLVYTYANFFTDSKMLSNIFIDLIHESIFHLKSFARMMSKMGLLTVPRTIMEQVYKFDDLQKFLIDGIKEEENAKEECIRLSTAVNNKELGSFFEFINYQENFHIELMEKALAHIKGENIV